VLAAQIGGMPLVFGMTIAAGMMEVAIALLLTHLRVVITPVLSGLTVCRRTPAALSVSDKCSTSTTRRFRRSTGISW
jgi:hypothetical protein